MSLQSWVGATLLPSTLSESHITQTHSGTTFVEAVLAPSPNGTTHLGQDDASARALA